jgi:Ni/Co efflux regulator RcnB
MYNIKTLLAAASMAVAMAAGASSANAVPWDRQMDRHMPMHRNIVVHERVVEVLRAHHYRFIADPVFVRGHYVVKSFDRFGHIVFVEIDPYSGAFIGPFRV